MPVILDPADSATGFEADARVPALHALLKTTQQI
jgi:hypothetical protein